jgi:hypothetical protein
MDAAFVPWTPERPAIDRVAVRVAPLHHPVRLGAGDV